MPLVRDPNLQAGPRPRLIPDPNLTIKTERNSAVRLFERAGLLFSSGFYDGLANVIGMPVDALNAAFEFVGVPVSKEPVGGSKDLKRSMREGGLLGQIGLLERGVKVGEDVKAEGFAGRVVQRVGQEVGGAVVPAAGSFVAASRVGRIATRPSAFRDILETIRRQPGTAGIVEGVGAVGGGAGAQTFKEIFPESPTAEMIGQTGGSLGLSLIRPPVAFRAAKGLAQKVASPFTKGGTKREASRVLKSQLVSDPDEVARRIEDVDKFITEQLGVRPTSAQASGDPGLITMERAVSRTSPGAKGALEDIVTQQRRAVRTELDASIPAGNAEDVGTAVEGRISTMRQRMDQAVKQADERIAESVQTSGVESIDLNRIIRQELDGLEEQAQTAARKLFNDLDPNGIIRVKTQRLKTEVTSIRKSLAKAENKSNVPDDVFNVIGKYEGEESLSEIMALRSRLTDDLRNEAAQLPPNRRLIARLLKMKDTLDEAIINDVAGGPETAIKYEHARQSFRDEVADKFRRGTVARITRRGALGEPSKVPESETISQFFRAGKGATESAQDFKRVFSSSEAAKNAINEAAIDDFASFSLNPDGKLNIGRARTWITRHKDALAEFPVIEARVKEALQSGEAADVLRVRVAKTMQRFEKSGLKFFLGSDPDTAVTRLINDPKDLGLVVRFVKQDPAALKGLRSAIWRRGIKQTETGAFDEDIASFFLSPNKMRKFLQSNRKNFVRSGLYSEAELTRIEKIIKAAEFVNRSTTTGLTGGSDTAVNMTVFGIIGRVAGARVGRIFGTIQSAGLGARLGARIANAIGGQRANALLEQALIDPDVARTLLLRVTAATTPVITRRLRGHLLNLGPTALGTNRE